MVLLDLLVFLIYFAPSIVAFVRDVNRPGALLLVNLCFGWTMIGWLLTMFWAWGKGTPTWIPDFKE